MKEGRIFEYTVQHISVFKNLFEVLSGVLHEVEIIHIKPEKPIDAEKDDSDSENDNSDNNNTDNDESESESGSDSESNKSTKSNKSNKNKSDKT